MWPWHDLRKERDRRRGAVPFPSLLLLYRVGADLELIGFALKTVQVFVYRVVVDADAMHGIDHLGLRCRGALGQW